jgi:hypothetical protein
MFRYCSLNCDSLNTARGVSYLVEVQIHVGPGNTCHTIEPEARDRGYVFLEQLKNLVLVRQVLSIIAEEELDEGLDLSGKTRLE